MPEKEAGSTDAADSRHLKSGDATDVVSSLLSLRQTGSASTVPLTRLRIPYSIILPQTSSSSTQISGQPPTHLSDGAAKLTTNSTAAADLSYTLASASSHHASRTPKISCLSSATGKTPAAVTPPFAVIRLPQSMSQIEVARPLSEDRCLLLAIMHEDLELSAHLVRNHYKDQCWNHCKDQCAPDHRSADQMWTSLHCVAFKGYTNLSRLILDCCDQVSGQSIGERAMHRVRRSPELTCWHSVSGHCILTIRVWSALVCSNKR